MRAWPSRTDLKQYCRGFLPVFVALGAVLPASARQESAPGSYVLDVIVNDWPLNLVARFWERDGRLCVLADEFAGLGFELKEEFVSTADGSRKVCLQDVPGLSWKLDLRNQSISITAPFDRLKRARLSVAPRIERVESVAGTGGVLAYDAYGEYSFEREDPYYHRFLSTSLDARFYTPTFTAETTGYFTLSDGDEPSLVRLDTWVDFDNPDRVERLRVGDSYTTGLEWVQPVRYAGVHWGTNFGLRPDILTTPSLTLDENLATPSTIDVFINGVHRFTDKATPGAFELADLPTLSGVNSVRVVVTDTNGRRRDQVLPLYSAPRLLAPGLSEYNVLAGAARKDYGVRSNAYGDLFASANYRHGLSQTLTLSGEINGADNYMSAAAGGAASIFDQFLIFGGASVSDGAPGTGLAWLASIERSDDWSNFSLRYSKADDRYRDLSARLGYGSLTELGLATAGVTMGWAGNLNFTYAVQRAPRQPRIKIATITYTLDLFDRRASLLMSGYTDVDSGNWGGTVSLVFPLGQHTRANVDANRSQSGNYYSAQAHGDAYDQKLNWSVVATEGAFDGGYAEADWQGRHFDIGGRVVTINGSSAVEADLAQSFIFMPEGAFVAGRIDDGFTLVKVDDFPDVEVFLENRPIGRTDRHGNLLITGLESYVGNAISIDPQDLPIDAQISKTAALVAPRQGSGAVTRFEVIHELAALVTLHLPDGGAPPVGSLAAIVGTDRIAPVGYDGEVYISGLAAGSNQIDVTWNGGHCVASLDAGSAWGRVAKPGDVTCAP